MNPRADHFTGIRSEPSQRPARVRVLLVAVGSVSLLLALGSFVSSWRFVSTAQQATAVVSELREQKFRGGFRYAPTFMFRDAGGTQHTKVSSAFVSKFGYRVGALVPVLYAPSNPASVRLDNYRELWGFPTLTGILGGLCLFVARSFGFRRKPLLG